VNVESAFLVFCNDCSVDKDFCRIDHKIKNVVTTEKIMLMSNSESEIGDFHSIKTIYFTY
jgi:hypothetical protein